MTLLSLWLLQCIRTGRLRLARTWAWLFLLLFFGWVGLQLLEWPRALLGWASPATVGAYDRLLPDSQWRAAPLSVFP